MRTSALLALAIAAALIVAIALRTPAQAATDPPPSDTITLKPGLNAVGWVAEPRSTESLFNEIPQLESIWSWDNWDQKWRAAARDVPAALHTLKRLAPGQAALFSLSGNEEIEFTRSLEVATGTVSLTPGTNLATWLGRDQVPLSHALKGIGRSFESAQIWNSESQQWTQPAEESFINRGDPLLVNAAWPVVWLQPTYVMPPVSAPRHPSDPQQQQADEQEHEDYVRQVLEFYDNRWAIQADPFRFAVYAPSNRTAFASQLNKDGIISEEEVATHRLGCAGLGGYAISYGYVICPNVSGLGIHAHEYFHVVQSQLERSSLECPLCLHSLHPSYLLEMGIDMAFDIDAVWIIEGSAELAKKMTEAAASESTDDYLASERERFIRSLGPHAPQLADTRRHEEGIWEYDLGFLAFDQLAAAAGDDAIVELFRIPRAKWIGPGVRWLQSIDLASRFRLVFGVEFDSFLDQFAQWQCEQATRNFGLSDDRCKDLEDVAQPPLRDATSNNPAIKGIVTGPGGILLESVFMRVCRADFWCGLGEGQTDSNGAFEISLCSLEGLCEPSMLALNLGEDCQEYRVHLDELESDDLSDLQIEIPLNACGPRITGTARVEERPDLTLSRVWAVSSAGQNVVFRWITRADAGEAVFTHDGRFWLTVSHTWPTPDTDVLILLSFSDKTGHPACDVFYDPSTPQGYVVGSRLQYNWVEDPYRDIAIEVPPEGISDMEIVVDPADCG